MAYGKKICIDVYEQWIWKWSSSKFSGLFKQQTETVIAWSGGLAFESHITFVDLNGLMSSAIRFSTTKTSKCIQKPERLSVNIPTAHTLRNPASILVDTKRYPTFVFLYWMFERET